MRYNILLPLFAFVLFIGCKSQVLETEQRLSGIEKRNIPIREYSVQAVLWQQHSAEYRALAYQAFNLAKMQLDSILNAKTENRKPIAIVTDVDETVLDNSPFSGKQIELDEEYTHNRWKEWGEKKKATAVPGALSFLNYAKNRGVEVFYISNRTLDQQKETAENLQTVGFPYADEMHIFLKDSTSRKEPRRGIVQESYNIVLFIGDNLSDFSKVFDDRSTEERNSRVDSLKATFGKTFIVLPNPMYGDWETKGILEGKTNWNTLQKDSIRHRKIKGY